MPVSFFFNLRKGETTNITAKVTRTDGKAFNITKIKPTQTWAQAVQRALLIILPGATLGLLSATQTILF